MPDSFSAAELEQDLTRIGLQPGDTAMVHASLKAIGAVEGGPESIVAALLARLGPRGTLLAYVSWDRSPYDETLNGRTLTDAQKAAWPAFDPRTAGTEPSFGALNRFLARWPGAQRSSYPDASFCAIGAAAAELTRDHRPGQAYGPGSPLERFVALQGRVLLLGAPLDAVTVLHYAEAVARIPGKRRVSYENPFPTGDGGKQWVLCEEFDSNGILDRFAGGDGPDAVECIARDYVAQGHGRTGRFGAARAHLFEAPHIVRFGVDWLESRFRT